jgi:hypothetical protein
MLRYFDSVIDVGTLPTIPTNLVDYLAGRTNNEMKVLTTRKDEYEEYIERGMTLYDAAVPVFLKQFKPHLEVVQVHYGDIETSVVTADSEEWGLLESIAELCPSSCPSSKAECLNRSHGRPGGVKLCLATLHIPENQSTHLSFDIRKKNQREACRKAVGMVLSLVLP